MLSLARIEGKSRHGVSVAGFLASPICKRPLFQWKIWANEENNGGEPVEIAGTALGMTQDQFRKPKKQLLLVHVVISYGKQNRFRF